VPPASKRACEATPPSHRAKGLAIGAVLAALTLLAYSGVLSNGFVEYDDQAYVTRNRHVLSGITWEGIRWAFTTGHAANWHPLTWISHMLDCELFGLRAAGHHAVSAALHLISALLLFRLFLRMTAAPWPSAFVAAVFALHPLHVESVAWAAERKDVLSGLFWILTTLAYVSWVEKHGAWRYALVLALFALGLLSKPMVVSLPFVLLLLDAWPLRRMGPPLGERRGGRSLARLVLEKLPLFALAAASATITYFVQRATDTMSLGEQIPMGLRVQNALVAYARYLGKAFLPTGLIVHYPHPAEAYPDAWVAFAAALAAGLTGWVLFRWRRQPWLAVGWLWFVGTLIPVIGLVQVGSQAIADRYTYIPMIGLSAAIAFAVAEPCRGSRVGRWAVGILFGLAVALWTGQTRKQVGYWKDDEALFGHAVEVMPDNYLAHGQLANFYLAQGRLEQAVGEYQAALRLWPSYAQGHNNVGTLLEQLGRRAEAVASYRTALHWWPECPEAHNNLGRILASEGKTEEAIAHYRASLQGSPESADTHVNLAAALHATGAVDEAIAHYERALQLNPSMSSAPEVRQRVETLRAAK
jgi:tetratricopeptide (TPR) repeat protein